MPFQSTAQQRWAHATDQPFAKRWDKLTNFKRLPYKKRKAVSTTPTTTYAHGNGGLFSTPGLGGAKKRKRTPYRTKSYTLDQLEAFVSSLHYDSATAGLIAQGIPELPRLKGESFGPGITRIHGNLCNVHGRYGPCDAALSGKKKPLKPRKGRKPAKTDAQRATERTQRQAARQQATTTQQALNITKVGDATDLGDHLANLNQFSQGKPLRPQDVAELTKRGLLEVGSDGMPRQTEQAHVLLNAAKRGDAQGARDAASRAQDRVTQGQDRQAAHTARQQAAQAKHDQVAQARQARIDAAAKRQAAKKPAKAGASGGSKQPAVAAATTPKPIKAIARQSLPSAPALNSAPLKPFKPAAAAKPAAAPKAPAKQIAPALADAAQSLSDGKTLSDSDTQALIRNGLAKPDKTGQMVLTAAGQRVTTKAMTNVPQAITHLQQAMQIHRGHMANPDAVPSPESAEAEMQHIQAALAALGVPVAPMAMTKDTASFRVFKDSTGRHRWVAQSSTAFQDRDKEIVSTKALADDCRWADTHDNAYGPLRWWHTPGLDLGDCDFNAMHGRVLIESGTFRSAAIAQKVARAAGDLEISLGFIHLPSEPDASGVFHHIRRFERSLVPRGKASNRFTAFTVKETPRMDASKREYMKTVLGFNDAQITEIEKNSDETMKAAEAEGVAYKADEPELELPDMILNGITYKAFPPKAAPAAADAPVEGSPEEEAAETPAEEAAEPDAMDDAGGLTLSPEDIQAIGQAVSEALTNALGPLVSTMDLTNKIGTHMNDLKTMMGGYQTKKDAEAAQAAEQINALATKVAELTGDQPAAPYRPSQAANNVLTDATMLAAAKSTFDPNAEDPWADIKRGFGIGQPRQ